MAAVALNDGNANANTVSKHTDRSIQSTRKSLRRLAQLEYLSSSTTGRFKVAKLVPSDLILREMGEDNAVADLVAATFPPLSAIDICLAQKLTASSHKDMLVDADPNDASLSVRRNHSHSLEPWS